MKKLIIGGLVGGILVFLWQMLSWTMLNLHGPEYKQAANQDAVISSLSQLEEGQYIVPRANENASPKEMQDLQKKMLADKSPWAIVTYHKEYNVNMTMNIIRGLSGTAFPNGGHR